MITPAGSPGTDRVAGSLFVGNDVAVHAGVRTVVEDNVFRRNGRGCSRRAPAARSRWRT